MNNISRAKLSDLSFYINTEKSSFVRDNRLLSEQYDGIDKLLKLDSENSVLKIGNQAVIIYEPYFDDDQFYCFPLKKNHQDDLEAQQRFLKIMYDQWLLKKPKTIEIPTTRWVNGNTILVEYNTDNIQLSIGFSPRNSIYPSTYALPQEKLPDWVEAWIDDISKCKFLTALGVHTQTSELVKLRMYLQSKTEHTFNLGAISDYPHLLINTLHWLSDTDVQFRESDVEALQIIRRIYDIVVTESNLPWLTIKSINDTSILYSFKKYANKKYYFDEQKLQQLTRDEIKLENIFKIIQSQDYLLIDKKWYPDQFKIESVNSISLKLILDTELLSKESQIFIEKYYKVWQIKINNKFQIKLYEGEIPYKIFFDNYALKSTAKGHIALDPSNNTIYINSQYIDSIDELLELLVNKFDFTANELISFKEAKNSTAVEIKTTLAVEQDKIDPINYTCEDNKCTKNDFKDNRLNEELQAFILELIGGLNKNDSKSKGYIYHFTHVENAASIIKLGAILPRGQVKFKDSAGQSLIGRTNDYIKNNFARFYFRPLTPTQWHNELLGRRTNTIYALCPVPIFFCFKLEDVLRTHGAKCAVSNGNLAADSTHYGNSVEFLDYFDFDNVYCPFGEGNYKTASQQEFIVKNGLHFSSEIDFKIICRNAQDRESLINLVGSNSEYLDKIIIDGSYYNDQNSYVKVEKTNTSINISIERYHNSLTGIIRLFSREGYLYLKSISSANEDIIKIQVNEQLMVEAKTNIWLDVERLTPFYVYFVDNGKDWLIYQYDS